MDTQIFVNVTTTDLDRSKAFYTALGCEINPLFTDENAACIVWNEHIYFMVLTREHFGGFTDKTLADPRASAQVILAMSRESREDVDGILADGIAAGGSEPREPSDYGFMYSRTMEDPDGNILEFLYMDPVASEQGPAVWESQLP